MDHSLLMGVVDCVAHQRKEPNALACRELANLDELAEIRALDQLHGDVRPRSVGGLDATRLENAGNARMVEVGQNLGLVAETREQITRTRERLHQLQRDSAVRSLL